MSNNYVTIGACEFGDNGTIFIYKKSDTGEDWNINKKIELGDLNNINYSNSGLTGIYSARFGNSISMDGNYLVVGSHRAPFKHPTSELLYSRSGSAYVFKRIKNSWNLLKELNLYDNQYGYTEQYFGSSVCIKNTYIVIGVGQHNKHGYNSGSVFIYRILNDIITFQNVISNEYIETEFGFSVSVDKFISVGSKHYMDSDSSARTENLGSVTIIDAPDIQISGNPTFNSQRQPYDILFDSETDTLTIYGNLHSVKNEKNGIQDQYDYIRITIPPGKRIGTLMLVEPTNMNGNTLYYRIQNSNIFDYNNNDNDIVFGSLNSEDIFVTNIIPNGLGDPLSTTNQIFTMIIYNIYESDNLLIYRFVSGEVREPEPEPEPEPEADINMIEIYDATIDIGIANNTNNYTYNSVFVRQNNLFDRVRFTNHLNFLHFNEAQVWINGVNIAYNPIHNSLGDDTKVQDIDSSITTSHPLYDKYYRDPDCQDIWTLPKFVYPTDSNGNRIGEYNSQDKYSTINNNDGDLYGNDDKGAMKFRNFGTTSNSVGSYFELLLDNVYDLNDLQCVIIYNRNDMHTARIVNSTVSFHRGNSESFLTYTIGIDKSIYKLLGKAPIDSTHLANSASTDFIVKSDDGTGFVPLYSPDGDYDTIGTYSFDMSLITNGIGEYSIHEFIDKLSIDLQTTITYHEIGDQTKIGSYINNVPSFGAYITFDDYASSQMDTILTGIPRSIFLVDTSNVTINAPVSPSTTPTGGLYFVYLNIEEPITFGLENQSVIVNGGDYFIHDFIRILEDGLSADIIFDGDNLIFVDITQSTTFTVTPSASQLETSGTTSLDSCIFNITSKTLTSEDNIVPFVTYGQPEPEANYNPVLTIIGDNPYIIVRDSIEQYNDPGATALDQEAGDITSSIQVSGDIVNINNLLGLPSVPSSG